QDGVGPGRTGLPRRPPVRLPDPRGALRQHPLPGPAGEPRLTGGGVLTVQRMRGWALLAALICLAVALLPGHGLRAGEKRVFRAGAYAQDVTPKTYPVSVNGGMADRQAKGA